MKKLLFILFSLLAFTANAQLLKVVNVKPTSWTEKKREVITDHGHPVAGAAMGGTAGYLLLGGPIGIIGGAMLGTSMSDRTTETVIITNKQVNGYFIQLSDSSWFRTPYKYTKGSYVDKKKLR